ncbi:MAG: rhomboid family intramembrane serine protease [Pseudomonadota bacterium]|nr:rhomboid family intramembrane serine protease [Pseudomonadota bacterium]
MYRVFDVSLDTDLSEFSRLLWQRKLPHQIQRIDDRQVLIMGKPAEIEQALVLYQQWQRGDVKPAEQDDASLAEFIKPEAFVGGLAHGFMRAPLTLVLIAVCCILAVFAPLQAPTPLTLDLLFPDFSYGTRTINLSRVIDDFGFHELTRMITPILLHGGILHLLFNMMWMWELGPRIERAQSSLVLGVTIVLLALVSNTVQYLFGGVPGFPTRNFGGMSGVVFGLFSYIWMWQLIDPRKGLALPRSLIWFMIASLVIMTVLNLRIIANEAHMGGFIAGIVFGAAAALTSRLGRTIGGPSSEA